MNKRRSLTQLLATGDSTIQQLVAQTKRFEVLGSLLTGCLPAEQAGAPTVIGQSINTLTLAVASNAWATRLRYQTPQLLRCLQQLPAFSSITRINIRVIPPAVAPRITPHPAHLSRESAEVIRSAAETITLPALRAALKRLAQRGR